MDAGLPAFDSIHPDRGFDLIFLSVNLCLRCNFSSFFVTIQGKGGTSSIAVSSEPITGMLFLISVDMYPLILQNTSARRGFLKFPDIFC